MKKKNIAVLILLLCVLLVPMAGSLAFFTQSETAHNVITTGNVDIELQEYGSGLDEQGRPLPFEDPVGVMPGETVAKIVQVKNTGSGDAWVRIVIKPEFKLHELSSAAADFIPDPGLARLNIDLEHWTEKDGAYYYNKPLKPGETTEPLFTEVKFSVEMGNEYKRSQLLLDVSAQAVQLKNNGDSALTAAGWPMA